MARSQLAEVSTDLQNDSGSVLWSFVVGEQLEFPITLSFLEDATSSIAYQFEAVVIEANNDGSGEVPDTVKQNGVANTLVVRVPVYAGDWLVSSAYLLEDVVKYNGLYYRAIAPILANENPPATNPKWETTVLNRIYLQFPETLGSTWANAPTVTKPVFGFFELRVTEPVGGAYRRTWKPMRGVVELLFSPTHVVP